MANPQRAKGGGLDTYIMIKDFMCNDKIDGNVKLRKGTLLCPYRDHENPSPKLFWFKVLDTENLLKVEAKARADMNVVDNKFVGLLEAVTNLEERLELFLDEEKLTKLSSLKVGSRVKVQTSSSSNERVAGIVRFKGPIGKSKPDCGILFGVELLTAGKGFTDGSFKGQKFFSCKENGGVFVPVSRLEPAEDTTATEWDNGLYNKECLQSRTPSNSPPVPFEVGSRVYVLAAEDQMFGTVTTYGYSSEKEFGVYVRFELDQPDGFWNCWFKDHHFGLTFSPEYGILFPAQKVHPVSKLPPVNHRFENQSTHTAAVGRIDKNRENMIIKNKQGVAQEMKNGSASRCVMGKESAIGAKDFKDETWLLSDEPRRPAASLSPVLRSVPDEGQPESLSCHATRKEGPGPNQSPTSPPPLGDVHKDVTAHTEEKLELNFEINSMVEVNDPPSFGVIRWIGEVPGHQEKIAGLELEIRKIDGFMQPTPSGFQCGFLSSNCLWTTPMEKMPSYPDFCGQHPSGSSVECCHQNSPAVNASSPKLLLTIIVCSVFY